MNKNYNKIFYQKGDKMKNYFITIVCFVLVSTFNQSQSQNLMQPITVSPLIGERLDPVEKRFFNLPPPLTGFKQAEFYIKTDSSLTANISYSFDTIIKDTVIDDYYELDALQRYLISKTNEYMNYNQQSKMNFYLDDNRIIEASLYKVDANSVSFIKPNILEAINTGNLSDYMLHLENEKVTKITFEKGVDVWPYALGGSLIGMIAGGAIGGALVSDETDDFIDAVIAKPMEKSAAILLGGLIGAAAGLALGIAIGNNITTDVEFVANPVTGYSILEKRALLYSATDYK